jgi:hypothetical protein
MLGVMSDELAELERAYAAIVAEARGHVAARREPDAEALRARVRAAGERARAEGDAERAGGVDRSERAALKQLERVLSVHRARSRLSRQPSPPLAPAAPRRRALLRTRPTISGNMDVRRQRNGEQAILSWDGAAAVAGWEVRFSERPDPRSDYVVRETLSLAAGDTSVAVPLGERPLRVHLLGRGRDGRLLRRALISALTRESWDDRWERRASAS